MPLSPVDGNPGAWADPAWTPDKPGLFAVIVGVSRYRHLKDGPAPVAETYGLGQLFTSSTAAYRLFRWLGEEHKGVAPVARVWLLLSPSAAETKVEARLTDHALEPTYANIEDALGQWYCTMQDLPVPAAVASQSLFFFSGHGLEVRQDEQILLPSDYLKRPGNVARAVGTNRLRQALASLKVGQQFFFLDACRNDNTKLRALDLSPPDLLPVGGAAQTNPNLVAPVFYATASGTQAWQQSDPAKGTTIFGDALLAGLKGEAPIRLEPKDPEGFAVTVYPLQKFLRTRITKLLGGAGTQPLVLTGMVDDIEVAWVAQPPDGGLESFGEEDEPRFVERFTASDALDPREVTADVLHDATGHEWATDALSKARLFARRDGAWDGPGEAFDLLSVEEAEGALRFTFRPRAPAEAWWFVLPDGSGGALACALVGDGPDRAPPVFRIELTEERTSLRATLAPTDDGERGHAARWWEAYEEDSTGAALARMRLGREELFELVRKDGSPVTATVAATLLLRGRSRRFFDDPARAPEGYLGTLAGGFPWLPDGAALYGWQALGSERSAERALELLTQRGLPYTCDGLSFAADLLAAGMKAPPPDPALAGKVLALDARLRATLSHFRPGGLFASFAGPIDALVPSLLSP